MLRVVSLVPSATETMLAWGVKPIGVTRFCEQGARFPTLGGTKDPNLDSIVAIAPDLVVMCDQENRKEDAEALIVAGLNVHAIHITHVDHVGAEMVRIAEALGIDSALGALCALSKASEVFDEPTTAPPRRVFVPIWRKPWMTINNETYGGSILHAAGFANIFGTHSDRYPTVTHEEAMADQPETVLAPSEPYPFTERQRGELESFAPTVYVDGKDLFWWGIRTPAALQRLQKLRNEQEA